MSKHRIVKTFQLLFVSYMFLLIISFVSNNLTVIGRTEIVKTTLFFLAYIMYLMIIWKDKRYYYVRVELKSIMYIFVYVCINMCVLNNIQVNAAWLLQSTTFYLVVVMVEEILFRAMMFSSLQNFYGFETATLITSALFSAAHIIRKNGNNVFTIVWNFMFSALMCGVFHIDKSIISVSIVHLGQDSMIFIGRDYRLYIISIFIIMMIEYWNYRTRKAPGGR